jgi:AcrR family transcriptional regulator
VVTTRRRLRPGERRDQLLDIGAEMFAARPYEDVEMSEVAANAAVSRALLYRYFPGKRELFAAIFQRASDRLLQVSQLDPALPMAEQVAAGLDAHFDYFLANACTVLAANRGAMSGDPVVQGVIAAELGTLRQRILGATGLDGHPRELLSIAVNGWLAFVRAACIDWLEQRTITQHELKDMCLRVLAGATGSDVFTTNPPASPRRPRRPR